MLLDGIHGNRAEGGIAGLDNLRFLIAQLCCLEGGHLKRPSNSVKVSLMSSRATVGFATDVSQDSWKDQFKLYLWSQAQSAMQPSSQIQRNSASSSAQQIDLRAT
jgi:hypothetical protein